MLALSVVARLFILDVPWA